MSFEIARHQISYRSPQQQINRNSQTCRVKETIAVVTKNFDQYFENRDPMTDNILSLVKKKKH